MHAHDYREGQWRQWNNEDRPDQIVTGNKGTAVIKKGKIGSDHGQKQGGKFDGDAPARDPNKLP